MYVVRYCPKCGFVGIIISTSPKMTCHFCNTKLIETEYTGRYEDGKKYGFDHPAPVNADKIIQKKDILENIIKKSPDFIQELYDLRIQKEKEFMDSIGTKPSTIEKCPHCGSTNFQLVGRKWSLLTGFFTNKVDKYCINCKRKVQ